jgi:toxin-antitoxin system PIN domain toxin
VSVGLLDVNILVALFDPLHLHHEIAHHWFQHNARLGWASCAITENGCLRVLSRITQGSGMGKDVASLPLGELAERLQGLRAIGKHEFWDAGLSMLEAGIRWEKMQGAGQITDAYLLALAVAQGGTLVTCDRKIPLGAVAGAQARHLTVLV